MLLEALLRLDGTGPFEPEEVVEQDLELVVGWALEGPGRAGCLQCPLRNRPRVTLLLPMLDTARSMARGRRPPSSSPDPVLNWPSLGRPRWGSLAPTGPAPSRPVESAAAGRSACRPSAHAKFFVNRGIVSSRTDMYHLLRPLLKQTVCLPPCAAGRS